MSLIKADLIDQVALAADLTRVRAEMATEAVIESFKDALLHSQRIEIRGFGVFIIRPRKRGIGRNPRRRPRRRQTLGSALEGVVHEGQQREARGVGA